MMLLESVWFGFDILNFNLHIIILFDGVFGIHCIYGGLRSKCNISVDKKKLLFCHE